MNDQVEPDFRRAMKFIGGSVTPENQAQVDAWAFNNSALAAEILSRVAGLSAQVEPEQIASLTFGAGLLRQCESVEVLHMQEEYIGEAVTNLREIIGLK